MSSGMNFFKRTLLCVVGFTNYCIRLVPFLSTYCSRGPSNSRTSSTQTQNAAPNSPTHQAGASDVRCSSHDENGIMADFPMQPRTNVSLRAACSQNFTPLMRCSCHQMTEDEADDEGSQPGCSRVRTIRRNTRTAMCSCRAGCPCRRYLMRRQSRRRGCDLFTTHSDSDSDSSSDSSSGSFHCDSDSSDSTRIGERKRDVETIRSRGMKAAIVKFAQRYLHVHEVIVEELIVDALNSFHGYGSSNNTNTIELTVIYCELLNVTKSLIEIFGVLAINFGEHTEECLKAFSNFIMSFNLVIDEDSNYDPITSKRVNEFYRSSIAATKVLKLCDGTNICLGDVVVHCTSLYDIQRTVTGDYFHREYTEEEFEKASQMFCFITEYLDAALNFTQICLVLLGLPRSEWEESQHGEHDDSSEVVCVDSDGIVENGLRSHHKYGPEPYFSDTELDVSDEILYSLSDATEFSLSDEEFVNVIESDITSSCDIGTLKNNSSDGNEASSELDSQSSSLGSDTSVSFSYIENIREQPLGKIVNGDNDWNDHPDYNRSQSELGSGSDLNDKLPLARFIKASNADCAETYYGTIVRPHDRNISSFENTGISVKTTKELVYESVSGPMDYEMLCLKGYNSSKCGTSAQDYGTVSTALDYDVSFSLDVDSSKNAARKYQNPYAAIDHEDVSLPETLETTHYESTAENSFDNNEVDYHTDEDGSTVNVRVNHDYATKSHGLHKSKFDKEKFQTRMHSAAFSAYDSGNYVYTYDSHNMPFMSPRDPPYNIKNILENNPVENFLGEGGSRFYYPFTPSENSSKTGSNGLPTHYETHRPPNRFFFRKDWGYNNGPRTTWL